MIYEFCGFHVDLAGRELRHSGQTLSVEPQVFSLLCFLIENSDRAVSKDEILAAVWEGKVVSESALSSRVKTLRKVFKDAGESQQIVKTIHGFGFRFVAPVGIASANNREQDHRVVALPGSVAMPEPPDVYDLGQKPSIAILPFHTLPDSSSNFLLTDALPMDLVVALSRLSWLSVIARGSSFRFRDKEHDFQQIGHLLNVTYCLTGVTEIHEDKCSLTIELVETRSNRSAWAKVFRFSLNELFELRDDIVVSVVASMELVISQIEAEQARLARPNSLGAWAEYHLGVQAMYRFNRTDNQSANAHFRKALELDPGFARAWAGLSFASFQDSFLKYSHDPNASAVDARRYAERGVELDPYDALVNFTMGRSLLLVKDSEGCLNWLDRALEYSPSFAQGLYCRGWVDAIRGDAKSSLEFVDRAMRLSPIDPLHYAMLGTRAIALIEEGNYKDASKYAEQGALAPLAHVHVGCVAVVAHSLNGNVERAGFWARDVKSRRPDVNREVFFHAFPFVDKTLRSIFEQKLIEFGL